VLVSDIDGVYDKNPKEYADAKLIETVADLDALRGSISIGATNGFGTGGITTKLEAAAKVTAYGIPMLLANGSRPRFIEALANGSQKGTVFLAQEDL
jgi:glutamate 5-kinase